MHADEARMHKTARMAEIDARAADTVTCARAHKAEQDMLDARTGMHERAQEF